MAEGDEIAIGDERWRVEEIVEDPANRRGQVTLARVRRQWTDSRLTARPGPHAGRGMPLSLPRPLLYVAAVALLVAGVDWGLKAWALEALRPDQIVFNVIARGTSCSSAR